MAFSNSLGEKACEYRLVTCSSNMYTSMKEGLRLEDEWFSK